MRQHLSEALPSPLISSIPAVISQRRVLGVQVSTLQVETLRSREKQRGATAVPAGQAAYSENFESRPHCALLPLWSETRGEGSDEARLPPPPGGQGCPECKAQLPSNGLYPGSGRQSSRSLGRLSD